MSVCPNSYNACAATLLICLIVILCIDDLFTFTFLINTNTSTTFVSAIFTNLKLPCSKVFLSP